MVKVIMHGCNGKMGQVITGIIAEYNPFHNGHAYPIIYRIHIRYLAI